MRGVEVSLEGIAVSLEIPGTLKIAGAVEYENVRRPPETRAVTASDPPSAPGLFGTTVKGAISLEILPLHFEIGAELMIGDLTPYKYVPDGDVERLVTGEPFPALFIVLSVDLPTGIPLGATGAALYALKGLFGMHVAPDRHLDAEGEPESWYEWYKADRGNESERNVTKVVKWSPRRDNYAFGAGLDPRHGLRRRLHHQRRAPRRGAHPARPGDHGRGACEPPAAARRRSAGLEGALYMLVVFDGLASTFQVNIDVNLHAGRRHHRRRRARGLLRLRERRALVHLHRPQRAPGRNASAPR
jgi:hypothetical protein